MKKHAAIAGLASLLIGIAYIRAVSSHQDRIREIPRDVVTSLPAHPSEYEHEVSVKGIGTRALKYFGISSEKLDRILKKYH